MKKIHHKTAKSTIMQLHKKLKLQIKIGPMKNKLDTLQMVMLGYLMSIMAAFYNFTKE